MEAVIVIGDRTSHGGMVITGSSTCGTRGKGWARVGDKVACPRCKGVFPISEGNQNFTDNGIAVAYDGCRVACAATLIASQAYTFTDPAGGSGTGGTADRAREGFGTVAPAWRPVTRTKRWTRPGNASVAASS